LLKKESGWKTEVGHRMISMKLKRSGMIAGALVLLLFGFFIYSMYDMDSEYYPIIVDEMFYERGKGMVWEYY
jgi:hypothetical protein